MLVVELRVPALDAALQHEQHDALVHRAVKVAHVTQGQHGELAEDVKADVAQVFVLEQLHPALLRHERLVRVVQPRGFRSLIRGVDDLSRRRGHAVRVLDRGPHGVPLPQHGRVRRGLAGGLVDLHRGLRVPESLLDHLDHAGDVGVKIADDVEGGVGGEVPPIVKGPNLRGVPGRHLVQLTDGEPAPEVIVPVQVLEQLAVDAVLDGVHHLRLRQHRLLLLLDPSLEHLRVERHVVQDVEHVGKHVDAVLVVRGRVHVEHGVVKVGVRVPAGAAAEPRVALLRSQKRDVLHQVRQPLLVLALVHAPHVHLQVRLEPVRRHLVGQHHVPQTVR